MIFGGTRGRYTELFRNSKIDSGFVINSSQIKKPPIFAVRNLTGWRAVEPYAWEMYGCGE
tara:strand:+ start:320 stop:499 length:180 start_codon:yes stop_codon:yes gene_type:complete